MTIERVTNPTPPRAGLAALTVLLVGACAGTGSAQPFPDDEPARARAPDAGPSLAPVDERPHEGFVAPRRGGRVDGGLAAARLALRRSWWTAPTTLRLSVALANEGPVPLALGPAHFALATDDGVIEASASDFPGACDGWVAPGDRARCVLRFEGVDTPRSLAHRPSGARASLAACAPHARRGLCPLDRACVGGRCEPLCGEDRWDGVCLDDAAICAQGVCRPRCSPSDPEGGCEEGRCVDGACRRSCASIAWPDDACYACLWDALELERCDPGPDRCRACLDCPGSPTGEPGRYRYPTTCDCLERASCDGCRDEATTHWRCLLDACPICGE
ncbi:MAG TPA: hypothetical protein RMH99_24925 [Sandaracinaceae bacterium LLY-WYZ-13_1]|nr:hypothetical protein [Sandaracinaceae bacterium LLY-WYZ-13_1]